MGCCGLTAHNCWIVERTIAWLTGCRRLRRRHECKPDHFLAFTAVAAARIYHGCLPD
ncbi:hypothetical protein ACWC0C_42095 [Streptomyces sp. NPDC001709]